MRALQRRHFPCRSYGWVWNTCAKFYICWLLEVKGLGLMANASSCGLLAYRRACLTNITFGSICGVSNVDVIFFVIYLDVLHILFIARYTWCVTVPVAITGQSRWLLYDMWLDGSWVRDGKRIGWTYDTAILGRAQRAAQCPGEGKKKKWE